jgi:NAD-dependent deacetylase
MNFKKIDEVASIIIDSKYLIVLVGAGLSKESGIPTFRGPDGIWTKYGEPSMNGYQEFLNNPNEYWQAQIARDQEEAGPIAEMRRTFGVAVPNPGHIALAKLEELGILKYTITQNIDDLHFRAGNMNVVEIHGNRYKLRCIKCSLRINRSDFSIVAYPPLCPECGGLIKGDGVMFGEPIPSEWLDKCYEQVNLCDAMLLVGTSGTVRPAALFPETAKMRGAKLIEVNPLETSLSFLCDVIVRSSSTEVLPVLIEELSVRLNS